MITQMLIKRCYTNTCVIWVLLIVTILSTGSVPALASDACSGSLVRIPVIGQLMTMICNLLASIQSSLNTFNGMEHQSLKNTP